MKRKIDFILTTVLVGGVFLTPAADCSAKAKRSLADIIRNEDFNTTDSIWESEPIEIFNANIQILDKISGKVFKKNIKTNEPIRFGNIVLKLKRCFKNSPEDLKEVYAFIEISEAEDVIFSNWLFASSPSINLFSHQVYDVRVEF